MKGKCCSIHRLEIFEIQIEINFLTLQVYICNKDTFVMQTLSFRMLLLLLFCFCLSSFAFVLLRLLYLLVSLETLTNLWFHIAFDCCTMYVSLLCESKNREN